MATRIEQLARPKPNLLKFPDSTRERSHDQTSGLKHRPRRNSQTCENALERDQDCMWEVAITPSPSSCNVQVGHSVYWLDELPANSKRSTTAFELTSRWSQLSERRRISPDYEYNRESPEWKVSTAALKAHPSERVCLLARPRPPAVGWQPDRPILPSFGIGAKSKAKASPRICQLAHPKKTRISLTPSESSSNNCLTLPPQVKPSSCIHLLALPKKENPRYCPDRPVSAHMTKSVLKAIASERLKELATPKPRKPLCEGFDPYKVSSGARAATASPRIQELSLPPARRCRTKSAQDEYKDKHM